MAIFAHYFQSAKAQVVDIWLEMKINEEVTKSQFSQSPIIGKNILFTIKTTVS